MPKVSVIIPNYNHEQFLGKRIDSILNQTFQDFELIILDDCSTDNSRQIIEAYSNQPKVSAVIYNEVNSGTTFKQWKKGVELAKGDFIWIAESDDYAAENFLEVLIQPLLANPEVTVSYCRSENVDENNQSMGLCLHPDVLDAVKWTKDYIEDGNTEIKHYLQYRNTLPNASAVLFRKPAGLNWDRYIQMRFCGDWRFWQDLIKGNKIAYSRLPLNFFRTHAQPTRSLNGAVNLDKELKRFKEYKSFVPAWFFNPFDNRYRWMMAEWIDRGVSKAVKSTRYQFWPELHPALVIRYYIYLIKNAL